MVLKIKFDKIVAGQGTRGLEHKDRPAALVPLRPARTKWEEGAGGHSSSRSKPPAGIKPKNLRIVVSVFHFLSLFICLICVLN